jgi:hypothetical protein
MFEDVCVLLHFAGGGGKKEGKKIHHTRGVPADVSATLEQAVEAVDKATPHVQQFFDPSKSRYYSA